MLYAAPLWATKHLQELNKLQHTALKLILGTKTKFNQMAAKNLCGIPPMPIQTGDPGVRDAESHPTSAGDTEMNRNL